MAPKTNGYTYIQRENTLGVFFYRQHKRTVILLMRTCMLAYNINIPVLYPSEWSSSRLSWRLWGVWLKTPSSSFAHWGRPSPRESAPWTRQLKPRSAPNSSSTELLSPCGGGMPSNGFTASQLSLPQRTALFNSSLFPLLTFCSYYIITREMLSIVGERKQTRACVVLKYSMP